MMAALLAGTILTKSGMQGISCMHHILALQSFGKHLPLLAQNAYHNKVHSSHEYSLDDYTNILTFIVRT